MAFIIDVFAGYIVAYSSYRTKTPAPVGSLGPGWKMPADIRLQLRDNTLILSDNGGRSLYFEHLFPGEDGYSRSESLWLVRGGVLKLDEGHRLVFSPLGPFGALTGRVVGGVLGGMIASAVSGKIAGALVEEDRVKILAMIQEQGGIDSLRSPCGQPTHCVRGLSNWLRQLSNPGRGFSSPLECNMRKKKLFLLLPEEYGPAFPAIVDCYTSPPT